MTSHPNQPPSEAPMPLKHLVLAAVARKLVEGPRHELALMTAFQWLCLAAREIQDLTEWPWKHEGVEARLNIHLDRQRQELRVDVRLRGKNADSLLLSAGYSDLNDTISPMLTWQRDYEVGRIDHPADLALRLSQWLAGYLRAGEVIGMDEESFLDLKADDDTPAATDDDQMELTTTIHGPPPVGQASKPTEEPQRPASRPESLDRPNTRPLERPAEEEA